MLHAAEIFITAITHRSPNNSIIILIIINCDCNIQIYFSNLDFFGVIVMAQNAYELNIEINWAIWSHWSLHTNDKRIERSLHTQ